MSSVLGKPKSLNYIYFIGIPASKYRHGSGNLTFQGENLLESLLWGRKVYDAVGKFTMGFGSLKPRSQIPISQKPTPIYKFPTLAYMIFDDLQ
jgi:hypothetical protein